MKSNSENKLASFEPDCGLLKKTPISLLEIMRLFNLSFVECLISQTSDLIDSLDAMGPSKILTQLQVEKIDGKIEDFTLNVDSLKQMGWNDAARRLGELKFKLNEKELVLKSQILKKRDVKFKTTLPSAETIYHFLYEFRTSLYNEIERHKFVIIDPEKCEFTGNTALFGDQVARIFPSASDEIIAAGNCLAADLNTAAVFHLMRVAEIGMRAFADHMKIRPKNKPIEHLGWDYIIRLIEEKIRLRKDRYGKSRRKNKAEFEFLKHCRILADELYKFKELWRNNTMHTISNYNASEAIGVFQRVRDLCNSYRKTFRNCQKCE